MTICIFKEWEIFGPKNTKIQKFHKICLLDFSGILCNDRHSKGSKNEDFFSFFRTTCPYSYLRWCGCSWARSLGVKNWRQMQNLIYIINFLLFLSMRYGKYSVMIDLEGFLEAHIAHHCNTFWIFYTEAYLAGNYMFKVSNRNIRTMCEICYLQSTFPNLYDELS